MHKLVIGLTAAVAVSLSASASLACDWYNQTTASAQTKEQVVAMSTGEATRPPIAAATKLVQPAPTCADGDKACVPAAAK